MYPDGSGERYEYGEDGYLKRIVQGASSADVEIEAGWLRRLRYSDGAEVEYTRDSEGRLTAARLRGRETRFAFNEQGQVVEETSPSGTVRYHYGPDSLLAALTNPTGETVRYEWDADARLAAVVDWSGGRHEIEYPAGDRVRIERHFNQLTSEIQLTPAGFIEGIQTSGPFETGVFAERFEYNLDGQISARVSAQGARREYRYDAEGQLLEMLGALSGDEQYAYDGAGNLVSNCGREQPVNDLNQVLEAGGEPLVYDDRGNVIEARLAGRLWRLSWDAAGNLARAEAQGVETVWYSYDALRRRIWRRQGDDQTEYLWAGEQVLREERWRAGKLVSARDHLYYPHTFTPLAVRIDGAVYCCHTNPLGAPERLTDGQGRVAWEAEYNGLGQARVTVNRVWYGVRLPGQQQDQATGLHYNRFRYYNPELGRYLSRDPIGYASGANLYQYAGNDALNRADPSGLSGWGTFALVAAAVAVTVAVVVLAPALLPVLAVGAVVGAVIGGAVQAATEKKFCASCIALAALRGASLGVVGAVPFLFLAPEAGLAAFAMAGAGSGALSYLADVATSSRRFSWWGLAGATALGAVLGVGAKYVGVKWAQWRVSRALPSEAPVVETPEGPPVQPGPGAQGWPRGMEIVDARGKPLGEFDEVQPGKFIEDKAGKGLNIINPHTGKPQQTADEWAQGQIFDRSVIHIDNLLDHAVATRPTKLGSATVPSLEEIRGIRRLEFRVQAETPEVKSAVEKQVQALAAKYPEWTFGATYGH